MNVASAPMLYYLHNDASFFKGNGFMTIGPYIDMPDNSAEGNVSDILVRDLISFTTDTFLSGLESA
jgi:hypothetical protein